MLPQDSPQVVLALGRAGPQGIEPLGTAFLLPRAGLLGTAAHVVGQDDKNLVVIMPRVESIGDFQDPSETRVKTLGLSLVAADPFRDLAILRMPIKTKSNLVIAGAQDVQVGEEVAILGFPHADSGRTVLTQQHARIGARILLNNGGIKPRALVVNSQARPGQSGAPVLRVVDNRVVAVIIGAYAPQNGGGIRLGNIDPQTLHQTTHAISAEYLSDMMRDVSE